MMMIHWLDRKGKRVEFDAKLLSSLVYILWAILKIEGAKMFQGFVGERPFFVNTYFEDFSKLDSICQIDPLIFLGSSKEY